MDHLSWICHQDSRKDLVGNLSTGNSHSCLVSSFCLHTCLLPRYSRQYSISLTNSLAPTSSRFASSFRRQINLIEKIQSLAKMPAPEQPFTVQGGCFCRAIRYRVSVPALSERPLNTFHEGGKDFPSPPLPMICIDHCNDCRRSTGSILPHWMVTPTKYVEVSCIPRSSTVTPTEANAAKTSNEEEEKNRGPWLKSVDMFTAGTAASSDTWLSFYLSSQGRTRCFCARCGTNVVAHVDPTLLPPGAPHFMAIALGTIDREDLEGHELTAERQFWYDLGIKWIKEISDRGQKDILTHPLWQLHKTI